MKKIRVPASALASDQQEVMHGRLTLTPVVRISISVLFISLIAFLILIFKVQPVVGPGPDSHIVNLDEFQPALEVASNPLIYDMRDEASFAKGHLPGAERAVNDDCHIYGMDTCSHRGCITAQPAFFYSIKGEEYHEVVTGLRESKRGECISEAWLLDGGFTDWQKAGLPIEK